MVEILVGLMTNEEGRTLVWELLEQHCSLMARELRESTMMELIETCIEEALTSSTSHDDMKAIQSLLSTNGKKLTDIQRLSLKRTVEKIQLNLKLKEKLWNI